MQGDLHHQTQYNRQLGLILSIKKTSLLINIVESIPPYKRFCTKTQRKSPHILLAALEALEAESKSTHHKEPIPSV